MDIKSTENCDLEESTLENCENLVLNKTVNQFEYKNKYKKILLKKYNLFTLFTLLLILIIVSVSDVFLIDVFVNTQKENNLENESLKISENLLKSIYFESHLINSSVCHTQYQIVNDIRFSVCEIEKNTVVDIREFINSDPTIKGIQLPYSDFIDFMSNLALFDDVISDEP